MTPPPVPKKAQRLKSAELKKLLDELRVALPKNCMAHVGRLVWHINWLEEDRLSLERELREVRQADMFDPKKGLTPNPDRGGTIYPPLAPKPDPAPRGERLWKMFHDEGDEAVELYLKFHPGETRESVAYEANLWAREADKEEVF